MAPFERLRAVPAKMLVSIMQGKVHDIDSVVASLSMRHAAPGLQAEQMHDSESTKFLNLSPQLSIFSGEGARKPSLCVHRTRIVDVTTFRVSTHSDVQFSSIDSMHQDWSPLATHRLHRSTVAKQKIIALYIRHYQTPIRFVNTLALHSLRTRKCARSRSRPCSDTRTLWSTYDFQWNKGCSQLVDAVYGVAQLTPPLPDSKRGPKCLLRQGPKPYTQAAVVELCHGAKIMNLVHNSSSRQK